MTNYTFEQSDYGSHTKVYDQFGEEVSPQALVAEIESLRKQRDDLMRWFTEEQENYRGYLSKFNAKVESLQAAKDHYQHLSACMYQAAGAYDMPVRFMDALSAAQNGLPFEGMLDGLLPVDAPVVPKRAYLYSKNKSGVSNG